MSTTSGNRSGEWAEMSASQARDAIATGQVSAEDLVAACLDRIAARDPSVEAWAHLDDEQARQQARALDEAARAGAKPGPLHGLPVAVKDIIDTSDMPTQNGSDHFIGHQPERDATCVALLRAAGAIIMGKSVTTELATLTPGKTRNPHNREHTPGGSSSGSAAAVAAGMVPLALGTQTGGSVVRPASFCGIHALKPTRGLISRRGVTLQSHTLDTVGVYGRSLDDLALITQALDIWDPGDDVSYPRTTSTLETQSRAVDAGETPKLAFFQTPAWDHAEPVARAAMEAFVGSVGPVETFQAEPGFDHVIERHKTVQLAENAHHFAGLMAKDPAKLSQGLRGRIEAGERITAKAYLDALHHRDTHYATIAKALSHYDALICLSATGPAPASLATTGDPVFNGLWTYLGVPTVSLPLLSVGGLPLGVTLVGKRREEGRLIAAARVLEARDQRNMRSDRIAAGNAQIG